MEKLTQKSSIKSVDRLFTVIETLRELDGARVSEVSDHLDLSMSTSHRYLKALYDLEYVRKRGDEYHVGLRFLDLGEYARNHREIYKMARPIVNDIAEDTGERSMLMVEEHGYAVYLYRSEGEHAVQTQSRAGTYRHLHTTAGGKAMLAHLPDERVDEIIDRRGLPRKTTETITDKKSLKEELMTIREEGIAFNREECIDQLRAVAAPITGSNDRVYGALSVSGPTHRVQGTWLEEKVPDLLKGMANELEINLQYSG